MIGKAVCRLTKRADRPAETVSGFAKHLGRLFAQLFPVNNLIWVDFEGPAAFSLLLPSDRHAPEIVKKMAISG